MTSLLLWLVPAILGCFLGYGLARWLAARFFPSEPRPPGHDGEVKRLRERARRAKANAIRGRPYRADDFDDAFNLRRPSRRGDEDG